MLKSYKYRIYPNKQQQELIQKTFGCCRFVYNYMLDYKQKKYKKEKISMSKFDCNNYCNQVLKKEYEWLKEVDKWSLTNSIHNMDNAYQKFFKEYTGYPKFKSKHDNKKSYKTNFANNNIEIIFDKNKIKLPKLKLVKAKISKEFIGKIKSATISQVPSGKYFVSILVEQEYIPMKQNDNKIGIDLGIKDLLIASNGEKFDNILTTKKYEKKLAKLQRQLAHKQKGSKIEIRQELKLQNVMKKLLILEKIIYIRFHISLLAKTK